MVRALDLQPGGSGFKFSPLSLDGIGHIHILGIGLKLAWNGCFSGGFIVMKKDNVICL